MFEMRHSPSSGQAVEKLPDKLKNKVENSTLKNHLNIQT